MSASKQKKEVIMDTLVFRLNYSFSNAKEIYSRLKLMKSQRGSAKLRIRLHGKPARELEV